MFALFVGLTLCVAEAIVAFEGHRLGQRLVDFASDHISRFPRSGFRQEPTMRRLRRRYTLAQLYIPPYGGFADRLFTLSSVLLLSSVLGKLYFRACSTSGRTIGKYIGADPVWAERKALGR